MCFESEFGWNRAFVPFEAGKVELGCDWEGVGPILGWKRPSVLDLGKSEGDSDAFEVADWFGVGEVDIGVVAVLGKNDDKDLVRPSKGGISSTKGAEKADGGALRVVELGKSGVLELAEVGKIGVLLTSSFG